jgi:hypothetical protein
MSVKEQVLPSIHGCLTTSITATSLTRSRSSPHREAEQDIAAGRVVTNEQMKARWNIPDEPY